MYWHTNENLIPENIWVTKKKSGNKTVQADVTITIVTNSSGREKIHAFTFRNGCDEKITSTGYAQVAFFNGKICLRESNRHDGYKIASSGSVNNKYLRLPVKVRADNVGDYKLMRDDRWNIWYLEKIDA